MPKTYKNYKYIATLILILAIAIFFRFWQFKSIPSGLYQDEAMNGADALKTLETGDFRMFYTNNNGREGMIIWLDVLAVKMFGAEAWVLRLFPALAGILAVLGLYFLTKELFSIEVALASSFFMAVSFWAVNFSRMGFRAGLMPMFLVWSFYFLIRGFKFKILLHFILAGILFGLGFYTYISFRFTLVLILVYFLPYLIKYRNPPKFFKENLSGQVKKLWTGILLFIIVGFITALPIGLYFLNNPGDFFGRTSQVSIFSADNPFKATAFSIASTLGMFNIFGDFNWRHNYAGSPMLFVPVGILFILGIWLSIKKFQFGEKFFLSWLLIFLLPNILSTEGNPHALRSLGAMPVAMVFAGLGLVWLYEKLQKYKVFWLLIVFLAFVASYEYNQYFNSWAANPKVAAAFSQNQVELANYLNNLPANVEKYVIWDASDRATDNSLPVSAQTVYFLTAKKTKINYLKSNEFDKIHLGKSSTVIAPIYFNLNLLHELAKKYSKSHIEIIGLNAGIVIIPQ